MKRPKQLPAVDRNAAKSPAVPVGSNVRPSDWRDVFSPQQWWDGGIVARPLGIV